jgi:hypothetical protein
MSDATSTCPLLHYPHTHSILTVCRSMTCANCSYNWFVVLFSPRRDCNPSPRRCWVCSHESTEIKCSRPVRKDRRERFKAATSIISALERQITNAIHTRSSDYARREVALDASVIARASMIASVVSTSSYSQANIKALPKYLQRDAYLRALYPLARLIHPASAMKWCVEASASMTDDELHALITSPKELKKCLRAYEQLAARKNGEHTEGRRRVQEADTDSVETSSELSDYNDNSSSSGSGSEANSSDESSVESTTEEEDSTSGSDGEDGDDDSGSENSEGSEGSENSEGSEGSENSDNS